VVLLSLQSKLVVSSQGIGLYQPDPDGKPQVFYLGDVVPYRSLWFPSPLIDMEEHRITPHLLVFLGLLLLLLVGMLVMLWLTSSGHSGDKWVTAGSCWGPVDMEERSKASQRWVVEKTEQVKGWWHEGMQKGT
jgi:hypothetical protein